MADVKISNLVNLAAAADDDELVIVDTSTGITKKIQALVLVNTAHTHDGETLQIDGINSNGGAFPFTTSGAIAFSHGQLGFPAGANPSADPNTLDDYEEGTWTPDLQFGGAKVGITYDVQVGWYTKIGDLVCANCFINLSSKGVSVGVARVFDYPFTCQNTAGYSAPGAIMGVSGLVNLYASYISINATNNRMYDSVGAELDNADFVNSSIFIIQISYKI